MPQILYLMKCYTGISEVIWKNLIIKKKCDLSIIKNKCLKNEELFKIIIKFNNNDIILDICR